MTALNLQMLQCLPIHMKQVICKKFLTVKIHARVMITTNIDVTDGLTNGAMGTVTNVVIEKITGRICVILVAVDSEHVGQEARYTSVYNSINQNTVPIH